MAVKLSSPSSSSYFVALHCSAGKKATATKLSSPSFFSPCNIAKKVTASTFFFFFFLAERRRRQRQQLCIEEEEDDSYRHLLRWLYCKEMATSAFLCGFVAKKGTTAMSSLSSMVVDFLFFLFLLMV
jgi:hypothetical protein